MTLEETYELYEKDNKFHKFVLTQQQFIGYCIDRVCCIICFFKEPYKGKPIPYNWLFKKCEEKEYAVKKKCI